MRWVYYSEMYIYIYSRRRGGMEDNFLKSIELVAELNGNTTLRSSDPASPAAPAVSWFFVVTVFEQICFGPENVDEWEWQLPACSSPPRSRELVISYHGTRCRDRLVIDTVLLTICLLCSDPVCCPKHLSEHTCKIKWLYFSIFSDIICLGLARCQPTTSDSLK